MTPEAPTFTHRQIMTVLVGVITGMALAGLDSTIVATSLPTIVGDLGGLDDITWVVTAYLLFETVATPLFGKLSDLYGRPALFRAAILIFIAGSMLCGLAPNLPALVAFRGLQGIGAGGLISMAFAIMGDVIPPRERGRYTGYLGSVFAVTSIAGPLLGGLLTDHLSWRWVFYVNVPVAIVALTVSGRALRELHRPVRPTRPRIDYAGAALLVVGVAGVLLGLEWGGVEYPWLSAQIVGLLAGGAVVLVGFVVWERRAAEPVVPMRLFRNDVVSVAGGMAFLTGMTMYGALVYLPMFLQVVKDVSATNSGLLLVPFMLGTLVAAIPVGRLISRTGRYKFTGPVGFGTLVLAALGLSTADASTSLGVVFALMALLGLGVGFLAPPLTLAVQNAVAPSDLGVATAGNMFFRNLGGSVGVAVFGALFSSRITPALREQLPPDVVSQLGGRVTDLLHQPAVIGDLPVPVAEAIRSATASSVSIVFFSAAVAAALGVVLSLRLRELPLRSGRAPEPVVPPTPTSGEAEAAAPRPGQPHPPRVAPLRVRAPATR
jgi:EmrB/QacA subfamily drug resistance transporter